MRIYFSLVLIIFSANGIHSIPNAKNVTSTLKKIIIKTLDTFHENAFEWEQNPILFELGIINESIRCSHEDYYVAYEELKLTQQLYKCRIDLIHILCNFQNRLWFRIPPRAWQIKAIGLFSLIDKRTNEKTISRFDAVYKFPFWKIELDPDINLDQLANRFSFFYNYDDLQVEMDTDQIAESVKNYIMDETIAQIVLFVQSLARPLITDLIRNSTTLPKLYNLCLPQTNPQQNYYYHIINTWEEPIDDDTLVIGPIKIQAKLNQISLNYTYDQLRRTTVNISIDEVLGESSCNLKSAGGSSNLKPVQFLIDRLFIRGSFKEADRSPDLEVMWLHFGNYSANLKQVVRIGSIRISAELKPTMLNALGKKLREIIISTAKSLFTDVFL